MSQTTFQRLEAAGAVHRDDYSDGQIETINDRLSAEEVTQLILIRAKLGGGRMFPDRNPVHPDTSSF